MFVPPVKSQKRALSHGGKRARGITLQGMMPPTPANTRIKAGYTAPTVATRPQAVVNTPATDTLTYSKYKAEKIIAESAASVTVFQKEVADGKIPFTREGQHYIFKDADIQTWIAEHSPSDGVAVEPNDHGEEEPDAPTE